jgi:hypothetical protein
MNLSRAKIALYMALVFGCGAVLGAFGHSLYMVSSVTATKSGRPSPEEFRKKQVAEFQTRLKLTDPQVTKLNLILDETRARVEETRKQMHPAYQKIHEEQWQKVREMLTPDQQVEYDKIRKEREERQKQNGGRPGPGL